MTEKSEVYDELLDIFRVEAPKEEPWVSNAGYTFTATPQFNTVWTGTTSIGTPLTVRSSGHVCGNTATYVELREGETYQTDGYGQQYRITVEKA